MSRFLIVEAPPPFFEELVAEYENTVDSGLDYVDIRLFEACNYQWPNLPTVVALYGVSDAENAVDRTNERHAKQDNFLIWLRENCPFRHTELVVQGFEQIIHDVVKQESIIQGIGDDFYHHLATEVAKCARDAGFALSDMPAYALNRMEH